ncbi:uncharacterized protein [Primulina eburnea]|uniref:uncharacterized protein isoform X2 n=1 Tax=Primulina eburnea TaxID=1245227 RepID=UPI003C6C7A7C
MTLKSVFSHIYLLKFYSEFLCFVQFLLLYLCFPIQVGSTSSSMLFQFCYLNKDINYDQFFLKFFCHTVDDIVMDTSENEVALYYALDEFITDCMIFLTMLMLVYNDIVKRGNRRIRRRTIRYNMGERIPGQISHLRRIVEFGDVQCIVNLRMSRDAFARLCYLLENVGGLAHSRYSRIDEKVAMFLSILAHHKKNRIIGHDYIRSGYTVSKHFHDVLRCVLRLHPILISPPSPITEDCSSEKWKIFKGCLGALDGTYIGVQVPNLDKPKYRNRKGSAADSRVLRDAISRPNGLKVPRVMKPSSIQSDIVKSNKTDKTRRIWSVKEEEALVDALKVVVRTGWKSENGFRSGYLTILENEIRKLFPETDIRGIPHINSKVHVWKKNHGSLVTMLTRSGIGWNDTDKMIDVKDIDWNEYVKADPNARLMRHKSWPFYHDWCEIFGKDRATGEHAQGFSDMVEDLNDKEKQNENDVDIGIDKLLHDSYDETTSMSRSSVGRNENEKKTASKKRKSFDVDPDIIVEMMNKFTDKADARLEQIAQRIGYAHDASNARKMVFEALENIPGFTLEERVDVAKLLVNNTHELELFFSLHDEARVVLLKKLLR